MIEEKSEKGLEWSVKQPPMSGLYAQLGNVAQNPLANTIEEAQQRFAVVENAYS